MSANFTHYEVLGVDNDATDQQIKAAYRKLARLYHPDANEGKQSHLFSLVNQAYDILQDESKRSQYDSYLRGETRFEPTSDEGNYTSSAPQQKDHYDEHGVLRSPRVDIEDIVVAAPLHPEVIVPEVYGRKSLAVSSFIAAAAWVALGTYAMLTSTMWAFAIPGVLSLLVSLRFALTRGGVILMTLLTSLAGISVIVGLLSILQTTKFNIALGCALAATAVISTALFARQIRVNKLARKDTNLALSVDTAKGLIFDYPAAGLHDAMDKFDSDKLEKGIMGEMMTADALEVLLDIPGVRIIHGMQFPGSDTADVDHAIICGNKLALVDSKLWKPARYAWGHYGEITTNGGRREGNISHFPHAVEGYRSAFPELQVAGWILIHPHSDPDKFSFDNENAQDVYLGDAEGTIRSIASWFTDGHTGRVDRRTLARISQYKR